MTRRGLTRYGSWGAAALAALGIVASCWSVAELSGAWSRAVPVVSTGAKPIGANPAPAAPAPMAAELTAPSASTAHDPAARPGENPLFTLGPSVSGGRCTLPPYSPAEPLDFLTAAVGCFDRAWAPTLAVAGASGPPVRLRVLPVGGPDNPCGVASTTELARYCDGTIYLVRTGSGPDRPAAVTGPGGYLEAIAHEYGRHLQRLSGVDGAGSRLRTAVGGEGAGGPLLSRRQELQASCLAGVTLADLVAHSTLSSTARDQITRAAAARGDSPRPADQPRLRGSTDSNRHWFVAGYRSTRPTSCNTWLASPAEVN